MGMETTTEPIAKGSFRGMNTKLSEISLSPREATSLQNVNLTKETIEVREGNQIFTTTQLIESAAAKAVTGIFQCVLSSTVTAVITGGTKIYSMTAGGVLADITGAVTITDSANNFFSFAKFKNSTTADIIIAANGVDAPIKWTGSGNVAVLGGSPPANFKILLVRKNRLFGFSGEFGYNSALLNGESWDAVNWIARFATEGIYTNEVTGAVEYGDNIAIFKEDAIFLFSGDGFDTGYVQKVVTGDGCMSGFSPVEIPSRKYGNIIAFVNRNGEIKGFNGTKNLIPLSDPIDITLQAYVQSRAKYVSGVNYRRKNQYLTTYTSSGSTHDKLIGYDYYLDGFDQGEVPESVMLVHGGITANYLAIMDDAGTETLFSGTYDGWVLKHSTGNNNDVVKASQIAAPAGGASRTSNISTITTTCDTGFAVGDTVIITGVTDTTFNGTFVILTTPTTKSFTVSNPGTNGTSGNGIARKEVVISAHWQSKKESFGNAAIQKQINDFNIVTSNTSAGSIKTTLITDTGQGIQTNLIDPGGFTFGSGGNSLFGTAKFGGGGTSYTRVAFDMGDGISGLVGRYFKVKFENVSGFRFSLEEYIMGVTNEGYQAEYV